MSASVKRRIVKTSIAILATWPLVHIAVVRASDLSPWKGLGWAMYCVPKRNVAVELRVKGTLRKLDEPGRRASQRAIYEFNERHRAFGERARPDPIADILFDIHPDVTTVEITLRRREIERSTATVVERPSRVFTYHRDGNGPQ